MPNAKGSTPAEVMGINYKLVLEPTLKSFADDLKKSLMATMEELISLRQQSSKITSNINGKRNQIVALDSHVYEVSTLHKFNEFMISHLCGLYDSLLALDNKFPLRISAELCMFARIRR